MYVFIKHKDCCKHGANVEETEELYTQPNTAKKDRRVICPQGTSDDDTSSNDAIRHNGRYQFDLDHTDDSTLDIFNALSDSSYINQLGISASGRGIWFTVCSKIAESADEYKQIWCALCEALPTYIDFPAQYLDTACSNIARMRYAGNVYFCNADAVPIEVKPKPKEVPRPFKYSYNPKGNENEKRYINYLLKKIAEATEGQRNSECRNAVWALKKSDFFTLSNAEVIKAAIYNKIGDAEGKKICRDLTT